MRNQNVNNLLKPVSEAYHPAQQTMAGSVMNVPTTQPINHIPEIEPASRFGELFSGQKVNLVLWINNKPLSVGFEDQITLGRAHDRVNEADLVDLSPYDGLIHGVSRRHIKISREGMLLYVEDLGSTNGSMLNGKPINPGQPRLLRDGDQLHVGYLPVQIQFQSITPGPFV